MLPAIGIALIVVAVAFAIWFGTRRRPRQDAGIVGFRKHIDALSPESRQEMKDRMREQQAERPDQTDGPG